MRTCASRTAEFVAPQARYTPEPGYVGEDTFEFEAFARGRNDQPMRLKVRVVVQVRRREARAMVQSADRRRTIR